jgi:hypothetical protein
VQGVFYYVVMQGVHVKVDRESKKKTLCINPEKADPEHWILESKQKMLSSERIVT